MLRIHLLVALRNVLRQKTSSLISLTGLATGMACVVLALLYAQSEYAWDRHHPHADRTYRVIRETRDPGGAVRFTDQTAGPLGPALAAAFPEVERVVRLSRRNVPISYGSRDFQLLHTWAEDGVLEVFDLPLVHGDAESVFREPLSMAITEEMARLVFGDTDPLGKVITVGYHRWSGDYTVTAVLQDPPATSDLQFHCLLGDTVRTTGRSPGAIGAG